MSSSASSPSRLSGFGIALAISTGFACPRTPALADDWPFFRGPRFNGVSTETSWTTNWPSSGPKVAWRKNVGRGASSFAVAGDRVITMGNLEDQDVVFCFDARDGRLHWRFEYDCPFDGRNFEGGTASTPTIGGPYVYTVAYDGQVHCLRLEDGHLVWRRHLVEDFGGRYSSWKYAGSPLVIDDLVLLDTGADGNSTLALDHRSGRKVWGAGRDLAGYSTPIPFERENRRAVLVFKARAMVALDRAKGRELWRIGWKTYYDVNASCPTVIGDRLFISSGYGGRSARGALFQLGGGQPRQLWLNDQIGTKMNSAVVYGDHVYCVSEKSRGQLMCVALRDGRTVWAERSFAKYGTLLVAGGKLVVLDERGELVVAEASPNGYHELSRAKVLDGRCWVMPVLASGRLFARNNGGKVVCLDLRAPENAE